jgi:uncharacterized protein (DUF362 family)
MSKIKVSVVKTNDDSIEEALNEAINLIGGLEDIKNKKNLLIKPNLCNPKSSSSGATVDLRIIDCLISKINSITQCKIKIVETNNSKTSASNTFEYLGYKKLEDKYDNVKCINLSRKKRIKVQINGSFFSSITVPEIILSSDYIISVAKLKTHIDYLYTGVLKNQYGFLLGPRAKYHPFLSKVLLDLNNFYIPDLCIIDGLVGMERFGPVDGSPKRVGILLVSKNPVAIDIVGSQIIEINPKKIRYLSYCKKKLMINSSIQIVGNKIEEVKTPFKIIKSNAILFGKLSLLIQKFSFYLENFGTLLRLSRSALVTVGFSTLQQRMSYKDLYSLVFDTIFKVDN